MVVGRIRGWVDRGLGLILTALVLGATLAFGARTAWAKPLIGGLACLWVLGISIRMILGGSWRILKSPLTTFGILAVGLAIVQLVPLPQAIASKLSPRASEVYGSGVLSKQSHIDDPDLENEAVASSRSPVSLDRPATLRWAFGALVCLGTFWGVSHYSDRQSRLYLVWGIVIAALGINTIFTVIQLSTGVKGLYGFVYPGGGKIYEPSLADALAAPGTSVLRGLDDSVPATSPWVMAQPDSSYNLGTMLGGSGAFLGLASLALPLAIGISLQILAPRGSRESLLSRLKIHGHSSLLFVLVTLMIISATLVGLFAGKWYIIPFGLSLLIAGLPALAIPGIRWSGLGLTSMVLASLGFGVVLSGSPLLAPEVRDLTRTRHLSEMENTWASTLRVIRDYPMMGIGLGSFSSIEPFYKRQDASSSTASSSLLQWWAESGVPGMGLLGLACLWGLWRLPGAIHRVGPADRSLAFAMVGAVVGFGVFSTVHWTIELPSLALSASALGGTFNRWLAGGTDLFIERA